MVESPDIVAFEHKSASGGELKPGRCFPCEKEEGFLVVELTLVNFHLLFESETEIVVDVTFSNSLEPYIRKGDRAEKESYNRHGNAVYRQMSALAYHVAYCTKKLIASALHCFQLLLA